MTTTTARRVPAALLHVVGALVGLAVIAAGAFAILILLSRDSFDVASTYGGVRTLVIRDDTGAVELTGVAAGEPLRVVEHVERGLSAPKRSAVRGPGGALTLTGDCPGTGFGSCEIRYRVSVPADTRVVVRSGTGRVHAAGLASESPVTLSSGTGDIDVRGLRAPVVALDSGTGEVEASGVDAPRVTATSATGAVGVSMDRVPGDLRAHSSAGSVAVDVPDAAYALDASTAAGKLINAGVRDVATSPRRLSATSDAGDVVLSVRR